MAAANRAGWRTGESHYAKCGVIEVEIHTDGACRGNPGPGGWGVLLRSGRREKEIWGGELATTNNRMELTAAIRALESLKRPCRVHAYTDSEYLRRGISEWIADWKRRSWKTADRRPVKNVDLWKRLDELVATHHVTWHWVRGHAGHSDNERADQLANRGLDELLGITTPEGI